MTLVDADTGEIVEPPPFTEIEASAWASSVEADWVALTERIVEGYQRRAWLGLGYGSWAEMCAELDLPRIEDRELRRELVGSMRGEGMSTRAIGAALGANDRTVRRDLATAANAAVDQPERITGLDGKSRPATRPAPEVEDIGGETVLHDPDPAQQAVGPIVDEWSEAEKLRRQDKREADRLRMAIGGWPQLRKFRDNPRREEVLALLSDADQQVIAEMEDRIHG